MRRRDWGKMTVPPRLSRRPGRAVAALLLLCTPLSGAAAAKKQIQVFFEAAGRQANPPEEFYFFLATTCEKPGKWKGDQDGCVQWVRQKKKDLLFLPAPGGKPFIEKTHFYVLPVCPGGLFWKNKTKGFVAAGARVKLTCR